MAHLISFRTDAWDPADEPENPINPIPGRSALVWIRSDVLGEHDIATEPDYEDWGWYIDVEAAGSTYIVGSICFDEDDDRLADAVPGEYDWTIQVVKRRRFADVVRRRNLMDRNDPLTARLAEAVQANPRFSDVSVDYGR